MVLLEKGLQAYVLFYITSFYTYIIRVYLKFSELPITGKNQEFPIHSTIVDVLFSIIGVIWIGLLVVVLRGKTISDNKLSCSLMLFIVLHVIIDPFFVWYID